MCTLPDIGQVVLYSLTEEQAEEINRRRLHGLDAGLRSRRHSRRRGTAARGSARGRVRRWALRRRRAAPDRRRRRNWWVTSVTEGVAPERGVPCESQGIVSPGLIPPAYGLTRTPSKRPRFD